jgi:hypothetical protein
MLLTLFNSSGVKAIAKNCSLPSEGAEIVEKQGMKTDSAASTLLYLSRTEPPEEPDTVKFKKGAYEEKIVKKGERGQLELERNTTSTMLLPLFNASEVKSLEKKVLCPQRV